MATRCRFQTISSTYQKSNMAAENRKPAKNNVSKLVLQLKIKLQRLPLHFVLQLQIKLQRLPLYFRPTKTGNGNNF